jgi:pimeloyl-ACP methyl ester carboxylesterase
MKTFFKWTAGFLMLLVLIYLAGPEPAPVQLNGTLPTLSSSSLTALEQEIAASEKAMPGLKPDNQARIVWFDSLHKEKTRYSLVYLHGFGASQAEGAPVHTDLARQFGCNIYLARLQDHGLQQDNVFANLTPESYLETAKRAVAVGKAIGENVIVIGTSAGGALTLYIASANPEIKGVILYSPAVDLYLKSSVLINKPWGLQIMQTLTGSDFLEFEREDSLESQYWCAQYRLEGVVTLKSLIDATMTEETFQKVKCPVFLGYYYKDEKEHDDVVSVPAMLHMYDQLGTPEELKTKVAFPQAGHHVIASYIRSNDWQNVNAQTAEFMQNVLHLQPVSPLDNRPKIAELLH